MESLEKLRDRLAKEWAESGVSGEWAEMDFKEGWNKRDAALRAMQEREKREDAKWDKKWHAGTIWGEGLRAADKNKVHPLNKMAWASGWCQGTEDERAKALTAIQERRGEFPEAEIRAFAEAEIIEVQDRVELSGIGWRARQINMILKGARKAWTHPAKPTPDGVFLSREEFGIVSDCLGDWLDDTEEEMNHQPGWKLAKQALEILKCAEKVTGVKPSEIIGGIQSATEIRVNAKPEGRK